MNTFLTLSVRLLDNRYHGRSPDGRFPEWPPTPLRMFQALVAGAASQWSDDGIRLRDRAALEWLEQRPAPIVVTPPTHTGSTRLTYVPNNNDPGKNERTPKLITPTILDSDGHIEFRYALDPNRSEDMIHARTLTGLVRHIRCLGWGIDLAVGHGVIGPWQPVPQPRQEHRPVAAAFSGGIVLRVPVAGTLDSLESSHRAKSRRLQKRDELTLDNRQTLAADVVYSGTLTRRFAAFRLVDEDGEPVGYSPDYIKQLAGRFRHAAAAAAEGAFDRRLIDGMILGHPGTAPRLSILPLPSIGHPHSDGLIRRLLLVEPFDSDSGLCDHLQKAFADQLFDFDGDCPCQPCRLIALPRSDGVLCRYVSSATTWASVTPVLLPGHNQRKQDDHRKALNRACQLVAKSLAQAGIDTAATFEISRLPFWPGSGHVRSYDPRDKLGNCPRFHVKIRFDRPVTGPLSIGAGRHVGFGTLADCQET